MASSLGLIGLLYADTVHPRLAVTSIKHASPLSGLFRNHQIKWYYVGQKKL